MRHSNKGFQLLELTVAAAVALAVVAAGVPPLLGWSGGLRVRMAASEVNSALQVARLYSIRHRQNVAVKFRATEDGIVTFALYRDGNGDGVRNRDIDAGIDPRVKPPRRLSHFGRLVRFGFPPGPAPRDPSDPRRRLDRLHDPIRFNRSDLASFSPLGTATPGSVYLTDGRRHLAMVRVDGRAARVRIEVYDPEEERWR